MGAGVQGHYGLTLIVGGYALQSDDLVPINKHGPSIIAMKNKRLGPTLFYLPDPVGLQGATRLFQTGQGAGSLLDLPSARTGYRIKNSQTHPLPPGLGRRINKPTQQ